MKELKILGVIIFFTLVTYWGVEPLAHSIFHPHVEPADFEFSDLPPVQGKGEVATGKELVVANCTGCHSIKSQGYPAPLDNASANASYGVVPPDLSTAGKIYNENFLANFIKNPAHATKTEHKFVGGKVHPMPSFNWMSDNDIASIIAYLKFIAPKEMTNREVFVDACGRCHNMKYAKIKATSDVSNYMGSTPPDLSMMIRSRGEHYLTTFINDPQKHLHGTAMPRVGLTQEAEEQVIAFLEEIGDSKKEEREALAPYVLGFLVFMAIISLLWKKEVWSEVE
ncbi:MAG TPA: cytochrome c1 [Campylobacterales bacterium]|nr:cytochrome c1 [Campylobacterales bacterium]HIO70939.1 cytochrome c1 [Campylobacterales bacterium]